MTTLLTINEAAARLYVHRATLYRLVGDGKLRITKVRGRSFITEAELERYLRTAERRAA